jgi:imidazolonepropionase-like amidohydrolase
MKQATLLFLSILLLPASTAWAQSPCIAIVGAKVSLPDGVEKVTTVTLKGDKVASVGGTASKDCEQIDGKGKVLTPGLIETQSSLGLVEVSLETSSVDTSLTAREEPRPTRASFRVFEGYNPNSSLIGIARRHGITSSVILPRNGAISGQAAWVDLQGRTQAEAVRSESVAMIAHIGQGAASRASSLHRLRTLFEEAKSFMKVEKDWGKNRTRPFKQVDELRALALVLSGELPLVVTAHRASDIERAVALAEEFTLRLILSGGAEAWKMKELLARKKVPVIVDPESNGSGSFDQIYGRANNAAILDAAGVPLIISSFSTHNARKLAQMAGTSVREGLSHGAALKAITQTPAEVFKLDGIGVIKPGATANVVLWSSDPLELNSAPTHLWIHGKAQSLSSRQTELRDRYMTLPGAP